MHTELETDMTESKEHPGFHNIAAKIAKSRHVSPEVAAKILAAATRHSGRKAHKANPRLNRVKG